MGRDAGVGGLDQCRPRGSHHCQGPTTQTQDPRKLSSRLWLLISFYPFSRHPPQGDPGAHVLPNQGRGPSLWLVAGRRPRVPGPCFSRPVAVMSDAGSRGCSWPRCRRGPCALFLQPERLRCQLPASPAHLGSLSKSRRPWCDQRPEQRGGRGVTSVLGNGETVV